MEKISKLLKEKLAALSDESLVFVVVEARRISPENKSYLKSLCKILLGEEEVFICGTIMNVTMAQLTAKDIKNLATLDWIERISLPSYTGPRS